MSTTNDNAVPEVDIAEAKRLVDAGALLLDVREHDEWNAGHAPDAKHIPLGEVQRRSDELPEDRDVVAICGMGGRSARATEALLRQGYRVVNVAGGMKAWAAAGYPVVRDDPA